jgi:hypothetical protein
MIRFSNASLIDSTALPSYDACVSVWNRLNASLSETEIKSMYSHRMLMLVKTILSPDFDGQYISLRLDESSL